MGGPSIPAPRIFCPLPVTKPYHGSREKSLSVANIMFQQIIRFFREMPTTVTAQIHAPAAWDMLVWAASGGPVLVELRNGAFGLPPQDSADAVQACLKPTLCSHPIRFTLDPAAAFDSAFRIILAFDPSQELSPQNLADGQLRVHRSDKGLKILAVTMRDGRALSSAEGRIGQITDQTNPGFSRLVSQVLCDLLAKRQ